MRNAFGPATALHGSVALPFCHPERTRISYFTALTSTTYVVLLKENHMQLTEAATLDRKSGEAGLQFSGPFVEMFFDRAQWKDLLFLHPLSIFTSGVYRATTPDVAFPQEKPRTLTPSANPKPTCSAVARTAAIIASSCARIP